ncbi:MULTISPECIES: metalloregulator ArsR/SmtB family transcription factor [unclassified Pseudactinotalea]|uniref:ArsR/SmtB family transcription factor n=1 Tax=unclassified Pseudactinotalea TaxID=2649176 RepID=UPI001883458E|nr:MULTISPECIES: metalloregulator ArsR/SmtB family transcription factor [unclassified Pseudactinotalea]
MHADEHGPDIAAWAERFSLLGAPTRLRLLAAMHEAGPQTATVGDLARSAGMTETAASQALRLLRLQGWVRDDRSGRSVRYTLVDPTVHELLHLMGATHEA